MNRRTWLTSLLALPLVPSMFRAASVPTQAVTTNETIQMSVVANVQEGWSTTRWIELSGGKEGGIEYILHDQRPSCYLFSDGSFKASS